MDGKHVAARDPRILAILVDPDGYFSAARRHAWEQADQDVRNEVDRRARARRDGDEGTARARSAAAGDP